MPIPEKQVAHIARLAKLKLSPSESAKYSRELTRIIDYFDSLAEVDTERVVRAAQLVPLEKLREDIARASLPVEEALKNAPDKKENYFIVPRVV
jgi:aspartyl-tRNA(Asn)/glutamyl-tRNA(Gln) amidotransferase subunit C